MPATLVLFFVKVIVDEGYMHDQPFDADETRLWWRLTSSSSLNASGTRARNFKKAKDRVTLLACSNASGTYRLPLVLINKSARPRCFKHTNMDALPVLAILLPEEVLDGLPTLQRVVP